MTDDGLSKKRRERAAQKTPRKKKKRRAGAFPPYQTFAWAGAVWAGVVLLINIGQPVAYINLVENQLVPSTVIASVPFTCADLKRTALAQDEAAARVAPVLNVAENPANAARQDLSSLFDTAEAAAATLGRTNDAAAEAAAELDAALNALNIEIEPETVMGWFGSNRVDALRETLLDRVDAVARQGIYDIESGVGSTAVQVKLRRDAEPLLIPVERLQLVADAANRIAETTTEKLGSNQPPVEVLESLVTPMLRPNLVYNQETTEKLRTEARRAVPEATMQVPAGATLAEAGDVATPQLIAKLKAHKTELGLQSNPLFKVIGNGSLLLAALFIVGGLLLIVHPGAVREPQLILLAGVLALLPLATAKGLVYLSNYWPFLTTSMLVALIPIGLAPVLATLLVNSRFALAVGLWSSFTVAVLVEQSFTIFVLGLLVTVIATVAVRDLHKRTSLYKAGALLGLVQAVFVTGAAALTLRSLEPLVPQIAAAFLNGMIVSFAAILLVPFFEWAFRVTSPIKLLELLDMRHPLIERLSLEAPGTYHHSLMVANLSQSAASEIGANDLLVRVAALYHDVGKLVKPEYFIENAPAGHNPHDNLTPSMSTLLIVAHVKEGITLARRHKLPDPVVRGIQTHHGTQTVSYFYHRAKQQAEKAAAGGEDVKPVSQDDFRYPGPLPESPEMGVLMLADSIEAASRTLDNPTPTNIEALVDQIIEHKLEEGQLDRSQLTFAQLSVLRKSFIYTLTSMLHHRVAYPKDNEDRDQPIPPAGKSGRDETVVLPPLAHAPHTGA